MLDQDKLYHLNVNKKEYTETTFEQLRAQMQKMSDQMNSADNKRQQPSAIDQSKCEWLPAKVDVNKSGEKAQIAGYDSQRVTVTATQPCKDKETGAICEIALVMDQWMSADFTESNEARKFYTAYASKMGMNPANAQDASERAKALFSQYKGVWTEVASKMQTVKGYPVKSSFTLGMGGTQCKESNSQQPQQAQSNQSSDTPTTPSGLAGAVAGKLGGLFKKKDTSDAPAGQPAAVAAPVVMPPGDVALMTVSSQLVSVSTGNISADVFGVPPGFKKIELQDSVNTGRSSGPEAPFNWSPELVSSQTARWIETCQWRNLKPWMVGWRREASNINCGYSKAWTTTWKPRMRAPNCFEQAMPS